MTAPTPEQMRALADEVSGYHPSLETRRNSAAALRAAADQLETLTVERDALRAQRDELSERILAAGTAPREDR